MLFCQITCFCYHIAKTSLVTSRYNIFFARQKMISSTSRPTTVTEIDRINTLLSRQPMGTLCRRCCHLTILLQSTIGDAIAYKHYVHTTLCIAYWQQKCYKQYGKKQTFHKLKSLRFNVSGLMFQV